MGNLPLLLCSSLLLGLTLLYFKKKWPDLDVIDVYIIFLALHFGVYPFVRGLYVGKGEIYNSYNADPLVIALVFLQIILIVTIIRAASAYFPTKINKYLKINRLIGQWARVNNVTILSISGLLVVFQIVSYYQYGLKSHILPEDFARMGKDLPYWLMSMRTIYNYLALSVFLVLASKLSMSEGRGARYFWLVLLVIFLPFAAYYGRKAFANAVASAAIIWLVKNEENIFRFKYLMLAVLLLGGFFLASNAYQTYRPIRQEVGVSARPLENPISAALNYHATLDNLKIRPGTWEFNYLVLARQVKGSGKVTTGGEIIGEGLKSVIPRIFWPGKTFKMTGEIVADLYDLKAEEVGVGSNLFGVAQLEFGYWSILLVPFTILVLVIMMAGLLKITINQPVFFWLFSGNMLNFFIYVEENQYEIFFMLRNIIIIIALFLLYLVADKIRSNLITPK